MKLSKLTSINNQAINMIESKQIPYSLIYSLKVVELKTLKTYIKIRLMNLFGFSSHKLEIRSYFFLRKDGNLWF